MSKEEKQDIEIPTVDAKIWPSDSPDLHVTSTVNLFEGERCGLQKKIKLCTDVVLATSTSMLKSVGRS